LRYGSDATAEASAAYELVERHHHDECGHDHDDLVVADVGPEEGEHRLVRDEPRERDLVCAVLEPQRHQLLHRKRRTDGRDQGRESGGSSLAEGPVGDSLEEHGGAARPQHREREAHEEHCDEREPGLDRVVWVDAEEARRTRHRTCRT
jgi:hypothetical protein